MIKATELRIGNRVGHQGQWHEVLALLPPPEKERDYRVLLKKSALAAKESEIEPIVLNWEWFLNFGFEIGEPLFMGDPEYIINGRGYQLGFAKNNDLGYRFVNRDFQYHIHFVHQLQNLYFSLTGTDLAYTKQ